MVSGEFYGVRHAFRGLFVAFCGPYRPSRACFRAHGIPPYLCNFCVARTWTQHQTCRPPPVPLLRARRSSYAWFRGNICFGPFSWTIALAPSRFWTRTDFRGTFRDMHGLAVGDVRRGFRGVLWRTARVSGTFQGVLRPVSPVTSPFSSSRSPTLSLQFWRSVDMDAAPNL